jgi:hypothetical protein
MYGIVVLQDTMIRVLTSAAAAALSLQLAFAQNPAPKTVPSVGVFLDFDSVPGPVPMEAMKREVDAILKPSGVALNWRVASENRGEESFAGLVVLKFRGKCRVEAWTQPDADLAAIGETRALGATRVANGRVLPFSEVQCDQVKRALAYLRPEANQKERQRAFGVALGRVVAHELYHILARTTMHAAQGVARASESLEDLVSADAMRFREEDSTAIRRGLTGQ